MSNVFAGKHVLVTGAASGIGKATAKAFVDAGAHVVLVDVDAAALDQAAIAIGGSVSVKACDVGDAGQVAAIAKRAHAARGPLDILVNNAGVAFLGCFMEHDAAAWERTLRVNLMGVVNGIHAFLPAMLTAGGRRHIVNVASGVAMTPLPNMTAYAASKGAVKALGEALGHELHGTNVTVQTVFPGFINTPIANPKSVGANISKAQLEQLQNFYRIKGCSSDVVARDVLAGIRSGRPEILSGPFVRSGHWISRLSPGLARKFTRKMALQSGFLVQ